MDGGDIIILTTEEHHDRVWVTRLCEKLLALHPEAALRVVNVDCVQGAEFPVGRPSWRLLVNRVADSSDPLSYKTCAALLCLSKLWDIPVLNGLGAFTVGTNKVLHHQIFSKAGLRTPRSIVLHSRASDFQQQATLAAENLMRDGCQWPLMLKPNAAGFGRGIQIFWSLSALQAACSSTQADDVTDGVVLLQDYIPPRENSIFRVWFLGSEVHCAMKLNRAPPVAPAGGMESVSGAFEGGCAGGECKRQKVHHVPAKIASTSLGVERAWIAWSPPDVVANDVKSILRTLGGDCHCGSVEFLYDQEGTPIYFDLNMVSTLPIDVSDPEGVWASDFDPWNDLATFAVKMFKSSSDEIRR